MVRTAVAGGHGRVIGFDMGGTSTDVSHYAGEFERAFETQVAGVRMRAPMMSIHTVAAGGGSILRSTAPACASARSAGANPGPASYRRGGPLATTDANVLLGKIQPRTFPHVFGPGDEPLDATAWSSASTPWPRDVRAATGRGHAESLAEGFLQIAVAEHGQRDQAHLGGARLRRHQYTLQCFGGAGGQHACLVADALGMARVLVHPLAGVLSAYGMGLADQIAMREAVGGAAAGRRRPDRRAHRAWCWTRSATRPPPTWSARAWPASAVQRRERVHCATRAPTRRSVVDAGAGGSAGARRVRGGYRQRFAFLMPGRALVIEAVSVEAVAEGERHDAPVEAAAPAAAWRPEPDAAECACTAPDTWLDAGLYVRESLRAGATIDGPAIIAEKPTPPRWSNPAGAPCSPRRPDRAGTHAPGPASARHRHRRRPGDAGGVQQPVHEHRRADGPAAAEHRLLGEHQGAAGLLLRAVRRRWQLIANAPHMPVHLGSMSESIKTVIERNPVMQPGDVYVLNDPYHGGTHLPDVTVVTPVYLDQGDARPSFYVASRGHHADIGGSTPGSMPPFSKTIDEEGVLFDNFLLVRDGRLRRPSCALCWRPGASRPATPTRPWPTCARRSPPTRRACRSCRRWWRSSAATPWPPTCAMCRTTPRSRCAA
jgi:5-oxoprolinase (ATP-hydrolysing)